jgi:hypothetical protein
LRVIYVTREIFAILRRAPELKRIHESSIFTKGFRLSAFLRLVKGAVFWDIVLPSLFETVVASMQSHILNCSESASTNLSQAKVDMISETEIDMSERLHKTEKTFSEFKDYLTKHFADIDIEFKDWYIGFGKTEEGHTIEIKIKLNVKKKGPINHQKVRL